MIGRDYIYLRKASNKEKVTMVDVMKKTKAKTEAIDKMQETEQV